MIDFPAFVRKMIDFPAFVRKMIDFPANTKRNKDMQKCTQKRKEFCPEKSPELKLSLVTKRAWYQLVVIRIFVYCYVFVYL